MSFLELSLKLKGFPFEKAVKELSKIKSLNEDEFRNWQENRKREIVKYHYTNTEFYRSKLENGIPEKWEDLPVLKKSDFQNSSLKTLSGDIRMKDMYSGFTSGSTGEPFNYFKDKFSHAMTWALIKDRYKGFGIDLNSKQARFYGIPLEKKEYYTEKLKDLLSNRVRFPVFDLSDAMLERFLNKFRKIRFDYVYGYTNSILLFARYLISKNIVLKNECPSLKVCICTSENCHSEDKRIISQALGVPAVNEYGASEVDLIAFEDTEGNWKLSDENVFTEVLDDSGKPLTSGGEGRLVFTVLHNRAMPVIRYEIGDRVVTETGKEKIIIKSLLGGIGDSIILPSGKKSSAVSFHYITRDILENSGLLKEFIIRQIRPDKFVFDIVSDTVIPEKYLNQIKSKMDLYLEPGLEVVFNRVEKIERTKAGKMKLFYPYTN